MILRSQNRFPYLITVLLFIFIGSFSCKVTHSGIRSDTSDEIASANPRIIFINYSIKKNKSGGAPEIRLINKIITDGKLKMSSTPPEITKRGDLKCLSLNSRMEPVDSLIISDPLNVTVESVNENNSLFKKEIALDSAQFSVRMQVNDRIYAVGIKAETTSEKQNSYLLITKIKQP
jgi:hypothetical protein